MAAPIFLKFVDVYTKLPLKWSLKAGIIFSCENRRKHPE